MSIETNEDFEGLKEAGRIVRAALHEMKQRVQAGVTTAEINEVGSRVLQRYGAKSAPVQVYGFPTEILISVNDEIVHGIPSQRVIAPGDLVKLDVTVVKDGYMADAAVTVAVDPVSDEKRRLVACVERALQKALTVARAGNRINSIGRAVEGEIKKCGFSVIRELCGHGIGRTIHEEPEVPNHYDFRASQRLTNGLVITIEPMGSTGSGEALEKEDGWTVATADKSFAAHFEHTIIVTRGAPIVLTA